MRKLTHFWLGSLELRKAKEEDVFNDAISQIADVHQNKTLLKEFPVIPIQVKCNDQIASDHDQEHWKHQGIGPANINKRKIKYSYFVLRAHALTYTLAYMNINKQNQDCPPAAGPAGAALVPLITYMCSFKILENSYARCSLWIHLHRPAI